MGIFKHLATTLTITPGTSVQNPMVMVMVVMRSAVMKMLMVVATAMRMTTMLLPILESATVMLMALVGKRRW